MDQGEDLKRRAREEGGKKREKGEGLKEGVRTTTPGKKEFNLVTTITPLLRTTTHPTHYLTTFDPPSLPRHHPPPLQLTILISLPLAGARIGIPIKISGSATATWMPVELAAAGEVVASMELGGGTGLRKKQGGGDSRAGVGSTELRRMRKTRRLDVACSGLGGRKRGWANSSLFIVNKQKPAGDIGGGKLHGAGGGILFHFTPKTSSQPPSPIAQRHTAPRSLSKRREL